MARILEVENFRSGYVDLVSTVIEHGAPVVPRGQRTFEVMDFTVMLHDPTDALPTGVGRGVVLKIAAAEALQLIGGFSSPELMISASRRFGEFLEPSGKFWGAYGNRIGGQIMAAASKLLEDPDTRQAVITLWDPVLDNQPGRKDYPCTLALQFTIRDSQLNLHVRMRSNDVWLGAAYDFFQFTQLQLTMCNLLGVEPGFYCHTATSMHVYERDLEAAHKLWNGDTRMHLPIGIRPADGFHTLKTQVRSVMDQAKELTEHAAYVSDLNRPWRTMLHG